MALRTKPTLALQYGEMLQCGLIDLMGGKLPVRLRQRIRSN